ncbi:unnamed protein product [Pseudo-nitzschia multistriata]|uniref:Uncharacterized protein n=1 Tax=Pseudo-nitzschia multistriata TaxID=183589 RepID=A0A448Z024_9STRA|nr:unnamed protein product [Pseudo-nitzschia multistriata]
MHSAKMSSNRPTMQQRQQNPWILALVVVAATFALGGNTVSGFSSSSLLAPSTPSSTVSTLVLHATEEDSVDGFLTTRREAMSQAASSMLAAATANSLGFFSPDSALAADGPITQVEIFSKLARIPTFCLVNGPGAGKDLEGVPFDIYNKDTASATGYFFLSYETAEEALKAASGLDSARGDGNIWMTAKIMVVPLSVALQLSLTKRRRVAVNEEQGVNGILVDTVHQLIPSDSGNVDAQTLDTKRKKNPKKWETKGRVPLFSIPEGKSGKKKYYFETTELLADYKRNHASEDPTMAFVPEIELDEMGYFFRQALQSNDFGALKDFVDTIQPLPEAREAAIKILKEDAASKTPVAPYNFDKTFLVLAAK